MIDFEYHSPASLDEALELLDRYGGNARVMSGGTALTLAMKLGDAQPGHVVGLRRVPGLDAIARENDGNGAVRIGALCTPRRVETDPLVRETLPLVADVYGRIATPRIRNMATVGGGLAHGDPIQDPPPPLIALGASVVLASPQGERVAPLEGFFLGWRETALRPGEILTGLIIPPAPPGSGAAYLKFLPRTADDYATVSAAAIVTPGEGSVCQDIRIVLGSAGPTPTRAAQAEDLLRGRELTDANIRACAAAAREAVDPPDDFRGSAEYKTDMAEVFTRRAIEQALASIGKTASHIPC